MVWTESGKVRRYPTNGNIYRGPKNDLLGIVIVRVANDIHAVSSGSVLRKANDAAGKGQCSTIA